MLDLAREIIGTQPILATFLAIGLGYLVGQVNLGGFSLGVGAVLFVGLAIGAFAPKAQITGPIGLTGLIMFLYGIGILYGRQFFEGMSGSAGIKSNLLALVAVVAGLFVALALGQAYGVKIGHTLGIFAGSMTSTATLQANNRLQMVDNGNVFNLFFDPLQSFAGETFTLSNDGHGGTNVRDPPLAAHPNAAWSPMVAPATGLFDSGTVHGSAGQALAFGIGGASGLLG